MKNDKIEGKDDFCSHKECTFQKYAHTHANKHTVTFGFNKNEEEIKTTQFPETVKQIAKVLIDDIEKHFPGLTKKTYDSVGFEDKCGYPAQDRAEMCIYIELLKAGAFDD